MKQTKKIFSGIFSVSKEFVAGGQQPAFFLDKGSFFAVFHQKNCFKTSKLKGTSCLSYLNFLLLVNLKKKGSAAKMKYVKILMVLMVFIDFNHFQGTVEILDFKFN